MIVSGEAARSFRAVRRDSMADAHDGELVSADDITGEIVWFTLVRTDIGLVRQEHRLTLGPDAIRIVRAGR